MIENKKIFAEIEEYPGMGKYPSYYKVKFITEWDITFLGKAIKHKSKTEEVPLLFKNKSVAEDYCSMHPYLISDTFINDRDLRWVKYHTYRILQNKKIIGYIKWDDDLVICNDSEKGIDFWVKYNMVDKFAENILVDPWVCIDSVKNIKYVFPEEYLSKLRTTKPNMSKGAINHWKYQLVEE